MRRILRAVKALLGLDSFGLFEAEKIYEETKGKFSPSEVRVINYGVVRGAQAMGHRVVIHSDAKMEREEKLSLSQEKFAEAMRVAEAKRKKEDELIRRAKFLSLQAEAELITAAAYEKKAVARIERVKEVEKAFTF